MDTKGVRKEVERLISACQEKRDAHGALDSALQKEFPRACVRVNARKLVPFVLRVVTWSIYSFPRQEIKIFAGGLVPRRTKKGLPVKDFSLAEAKRFAKLLRLAFIEELGIANTSYDLELFISYTKR